jgi:hypothetical protein
MSMRETATRLGSALLLAGAVLVVGCGSSNGPTNSERAGGVRVFDPPNAEFANSIGIQGGPINEEQAKAIAEKATNGRAVSVEREDQDGMDVFGVATQSTSGNFDVKVRVSDGAVTQIDDDDPGEEGDSGDTGDSGTEE